MASHAKRSRALESAVAIGLLMVLVIIAAGVFIKQSHYAPTDINGFNWGLLLPQGYEKLSETEIYDSDNLYEKINGKATLYTESGFRKLFTQRFANSLDKSLAAELFLYDMGEAKNAFSVYSLQKRPDAEALADIEQAYGTTNAVYLVNGNYYIELIGFAESSQLFEAMVQAARNIKTHLPVDENTKITIAGLIPQENLVPSSIKLHLKGAFGYDGFVDTFTAKYRIDGETVTVFLSRYESSEQALQSAKKYHDFLIENGATDKPAVEKNLKAGCLDFYGSTEIILAVGRFVLGIHEAENQKLAEKLILRIINNLNTTGR